jgi:3-phosphoshikimate 1-carboxyvinyltransferase
MAWLIDELPALSIAFAVAQGTSVVKNAHELRVKESDRIKTVVDNLNLAGIKTIEVEDGYSVVGGSEIKSATFNSYGDHRIAMSFMLLSLLTSKSKVEDIECIETSFPNFIELLSKISKVENGSQAS